MSHNSQLNANLCGLLNKIDQEFICQAQKKGCGYCGGVLHKADYPRSPFGIPQQFRSHFDKRLGLCCNQCRKRTTVPSVRFLGRFRYPAVLMIFVSALRLGLNERRLAQLRKYFGITINESTWKRWRRWWRKTFTATRFWQQAKGSFILTSEANRLLPRTLLKSFSGNLIDKLQALLRLLSPLTAGALRAI